MLQLLQRSVDVQGAVEIETYSFWHLFAWILIILEIAIFVIVIRQIRAATDLSSKRRRLWVVIVIFVPFAWIAWLISRAVKKSQR